ncbi:MAG TPA: hypothetical protein VGR43_10785 [Dehalococcoidia bacterium]|jgi:ribosomal protein S21|nr:hypothetical protein [Dehalococcoidia bacterium]
MITVPVSGNLEGALKRLKKLYEGDVRFALKRHAYALTRSQQRRAKSKRARTKARKRVQAAARRAAEREPREKFLQVSGKGSTITAQR